MHDLRFMDYNRTKILTGAARMFTSRNESIAFVRIQATLELRHSQLASMCDLALRGPTKKEWGCEATKTPVFEPRISSADGAARI